MQRGTESTYPQWRGDLVPLIADGVSSHLFEDQLLVFSERYQKLYALNSSAAFMWSCCEDGMTCSELMRTLVETYGIDGAQARNDVTVALAEWSAAGLITIDETCRQDLVQDETDQDICLYVPDAHPPHRFDFTAEFRMSLLGNEILIRYASPELGGRLSEVFGHLESDSSEPAGLVDIVQSHDRFLIYAPGMPPVVDIDSQHLITTLTQTVLRSAYRASNFLIAVHAAVLRLGDRCVILPGPSGIGKSTLAAALIRNGFTYFTDEIALVDRVNRNVMPAPVSLRIKEGGWGIVGSMFPELHRAASHTLADGSRLRYLPPRPGTFMKDLRDSCPAGWLIFPRYSPEEELVIAPISRVDAIARLQSSGYDIGGLLDHAKIAEILAWIKTVDCFEMKVNQLDRTVCTIRSLVGERATA